MQPSLSTIQRALREITEELARELAHPTQHAPNWSSSEWLLARAVASMHGVSALLSDRRTWGDAPAGWTTFLAEQRAHVAARHLRVQALLQRIDDGARAAGTAVVALKGSALHSLGIYAAGERPMADIDLLCSAEDCGRVVSLLLALGYHESETTWHHVVFVPDQGHSPEALGEHRYADIKIELHVRLRERLPLCVVDATDVVFPSNGTGGVNPYPSTAALTTHLLLHASGAIANRSLRLLHLHDLAMVSARMRSADWDEFLAIAPRGGRGLWWAFPTLALLQRYFAAAPPHVLDRAAGECSRLLRRVSQRQRLTDVSLSNLWVQAFPALEWARSVPEGLRYIIQRIAPNPQMLAARKAALQTNWRLAASEWGRLSQARRILRWTLSRPPRIDTMTSVRAVLENPR